MNPYLYNPSYAGVEGHATLFFMYRQQWTSVDDAPQTMHASFHIPLQGGIALGTSAFNVTQGLLTTSAGKISTGYLVNIDRTHFVRFGLSIGGGINSINITKFDSPDDPAFNNFLEQNSFLIGDFGIAYHFGHFNLGFSIPNLFTYDVVTQTDVAPIHVTPLDNIFFKMNYRGHITDDFAFEPHILYRYSQVGPSQYEGTLITHLKHIVWIGVSYREDAGIIGLTGAKIKEKIGIGFAYEAGNHHISNNLGPTFEVNVGYHLGTKKEHAKHIASFIKSHRLSAEERAQKAELEWQRQLAKLQQNQEQEPQEEKPAPKTQLPKTQPPTETTHPTESLITETERGDPRLTQDFRTHEELATSDDYLVVKRGNHLLELPVGNFVIAGAFEFFENANNFSDKLFQQGYYDTIVGFSSARGYYYVVVFQSWSVTQARSRRDELRKTAKLPNVWVLQVTE